LKDDEISKLREDNSNMFKDLKELAMNGDQSKSEIFEIKIKRREAEKMVSEMKEIS
jgi:hypothetical protein